MKKIVSNILFVSLLLFSSVEAKTFTYWQVHAMPKSVEKDYYIWRLLQEPSTTHTEAKNIIREVNHTNKKLRIAYKKKTGLKAPSYREKSFVSSEKKARWKATSQGNSFFKKGIVAVGKKKLSVAISYFKQAHQTYHKRWEKDKSLFWLYLLTKENRYLENLKKSYHINMYTLLAADFTQSRYPRSIITPVVKKERLFFVDATDPIYWAKMKIKMNHPNADLEALAEDCESQATIGMNTYLKAKACNYRKSYFPMPYRKTMKYFSKERQALLYAIARQESRFVPASVSRSFALGMLQFMPFLIDHVSKQKGEKIDYDDIFEPKKAIEYADYHLNYLNTYLYHPLFVAYAYNGGIGFTKRLIRKKHYFREGAFEPYLSMEKIKNVEAREYGKRVLTNYVVYLNKLGISTRLWPLIKTLTTPSKTDKFRK